MKGRECLLAAAIVVISAGSCLATPAFEFSSSTNAPARSEVSAGFSFTTTEAITVTALDALDAAGSGSAGSVRLYTGSGTVLASAQVSNSDPTEGSPTLFHTHAITPVSLASGVTYYIVEDFASTTTVDFRVSGLTSANGVSFGGEVGSFLAQQGINPTSDSYDGAFNPGLFGPNFDFIATVPEPGSTWIFGAALALVAGAATFGRRRA